MAIEWSCSVLNRTNAVVMTLTMHDIKKLYVFIVTSHSNIAIYKVVYDYVTLIDRRL